MNQLNEYILPGNRACSGCALTLAFRTAIKALGKNTILTVPAGCFTVLLGMYPISTASVPILNTAFETTASSASGIIAALKVLKKDKEITVVGWAGDGGTVDIGLQALSAAAERNTNFIYVCYDNEAYMNTGTQRSGSTPQKALTTTTPFTGKKEFKKDMIEIMRAHHIPYIATAVPSYPNDLFKKFVKAKSIEGTKYIHILNPCPPGWGYSTEKTVEIGKMAVKTGMFDLFEIENDIIKFTSETENIFKNKGPKHKVTEYLKSQKRFGILNEKDIELIQNSINAKWEKYLN